MTDADRAIQAVKILLDGRDPVADMASFLVTLEHAVARRRLEKYRRFQRHL